MSGQINLDDLAMESFQVRAYPDGTEFQGVRGMDVLDAAERLLQISLQREMRQSMYLRAVAFDERNQVLLYAKNER